MVSPGKKVTHQNPNKILLEPRIIAQIPLEQRPLENPNTTRSSIELANKDSAELITHIDAIQSELIKYQKEEQDKLTIAMKDQGIKLGQLLDTKTDDVDTMLRKTQEITDYWNAQAETPLAKFLVEGPLH